MKHWAVERHDHVEVWTYRNPPMNYFVGPGAGELLELIGKAEADAELRAIILTGGIEGKFITHYSVDELAQMAADPTECARVFPEMELGYHRMLDRIMLMPKAVIAATERGGRLASVRAHPIANDISVSGASTRFTIPIRSASRGE